MVNYNKMAKKYNKPTDEFFEKVEENDPMPVEEVVAPATPIEGIVDGCSQMYVRSEASVNSEPLGIITRDTKVQIYEAESTFDFYSVCTETGLEGFCMKKFISVL